MKSLFHTYPILHGIVGMLLLSSCSPEPRALDYGTDTCHACKMTLVDNRFGAELVTNTGKIYTFDDVNCMLSYYNSEEVDVSKLAYTLVIDFEHPGTFLNASQVFFLKSDEFRSPMASEVAAFQTYDRAMKFKREKGGILLGWAEVTTQFK